MHASTGGGLIPHNRIAVPEGVLAALNRLPETYEPGALRALVLDETARAANV